LLKKQDKEEADNDFEDGGEKEEEWRRRRGKEGKEGDGER